MTAIAIASAVMMSILALSYWYEMRHWKREAEHWKRQARLWQDYAEDWATVATVQHETRCRVEEREIVIYEN